MRKAYADEISPTTNTEEVLEIQERMEIQEGEPLRATAEKAIDKLYADEGASLEHIIADLTFLSEWIEIYINALKEDLKEDLK